MDITLSILLVSGTLVLGMILGNMMALATRPRQTLSEEFSDGRLWESVEVIPS